MEVSEWYMDGAWVLHVRLEAVWGGGANIYLQYFMAAWKVARYFEK